MLMRPILLGLLIVCAQPGVALAGDGNSKAPTLSELRERQNDIELRRERALRSIRERQQAQTLDPDEALMERSRINRDYQNEISAVRALQVDAYRLLEDKRKPARSSSGNHNSAIPRIQSQSVVTYPQGEGLAPAETPQAEGRQKNVGFGTRELEF